MVLNEVVMKDSSEVVEMVESLENMLVMHAVVLMGKKVVELSEGVEVVE